MRRSFLIGLALVLLAGCAATPKTRYYLLSVEPPANAVPALTQPGGLALTALHLPATTDRPQLVVRTGALTVDIREFDRWAEPFDTMVRQTLVQDLELRRGVSVPGREERRLFVEIDEFMADTAGQARVSGHWWTLTAGEDQSQKLEKSFTLTQPMASSAGTEVPAAMSALLGKLADEIASN